MSATNHTTNYNLPQFIGTDIPSWLSDVNGAMATIDSSIKDVADDVTAEHDALATTNANLAAATQRITTNEQNIGTLQQGVGGLQQGLAAANSNIAANADKIGSEALTTTAQTLSGAINELNEPTGFYGTHRIVTYAVGVAATTTEIEFAYPIINPHQLTPVISSFGPISLTGIGTVQTGAVDESRTNKDCLVFKVTGTNYTVGRAYFAVIPFDISFTA